jgi:hypothetical protein
LPIDGAARQNGLLRVLVGDVTGAAAVLAKSPGMGWSDPDHPGHALFPLLAMLLSSGAIGNTLMTELEAPGRDPLESFAVTEEKHKPKLATPSMLALIQGARPGVAMTDADRDAAIDALRIASCVAFAPKSRAAEMLRWAMDLRQQYWRRHAFREELARACESLGVLVSA